MTTLALGKTSGTLPAPPTNVGDYGMVHAIVIAPDPTGTATSFQQVKSQGVTLGTPLTIVGFAANSQQQPYQHDAVSESNAIDPTEFSLTGAGAFVTYKIA